MLDFSCSWENSVLFLLRSCKAEKRRWGKERGMLFPSLMCHLWIAKPLFASRHEAMAGAGQLSPPFLRDWKKEGITRWDESGRVQHIRGFYFVSWVEEKHHGLSNRSGKIKIVKEPESWSNSSLQPRHLWVLTFCWLLFCDALCVCEGLAKGPARQREARQNTNEAGQKSHRHKRTCKFLALGAEGTVPSRGDGPWDFEYPLLKK